jgi:WD40 repeat protein
MGNRNEIWIWDTANWQVKEKLAGHTGEIVELAFTSQEKKLLSASSDGTVRVWSLGE